MQKVKRKRSRENKVYSYSKEERLARGAQYRGEVMHFKRISAEPRAWRRLAFIRCNYRGIPPRQRTWLSQHNTPTQHTQPLQSNQITPLSQAQPSQQFPMFTHDPFQHFTLLPTHTPKPPRSTPLRTPDEHLHAS